MTSSHPLATPAPPPLFLYSLSLPLSPLLPPPPLPPALPPAAPSPLRPARRARPAESLPTAPGPAAESRRHDARPRGSRGGNHPAGAEPRGRAEDPRQLRLGAAALRSPAAPGGTGLPAAQPALPRERRARREGAAAGAAGPMPAANLMESLQPPALQVPGPQGAPEGSAVWSSASTPSLRRRRFKLRRARNVLERSLEAGLARELPLPGGEAPGKELLQLPAIEITPSSDEDTPWSNCSTPSASPRRKRFLLRKWLRLRERKEFGESRYVRSPPSFPTPPLPPAGALGTPRKLRGDQKPSPHGASGTRAPGTGLAALELPFLPLSPPGPGGQWL